MQLEELVANPLKTYSVSELRDYGISAAVLEGLQSDSYQDFPLRGEGYLGAFALNYLGRQDSVNGTPIPSYVPLFDFTEVTGIDMSRLLNMTTPEGAPIVEEQDMGGGMDYYIALQNIHYVSERAPDLNATLSDLATEYTQTGNDQIRKVIVGRSLKLIDNVAWSMLKKLPDSVSIDELRSGGFAGLLDAIEGYNPERGVRFETYASWRIRGGMIDDLRGVDNLSRQDRKRKTKMDKFRTSFFKTHEHEPSKEDYLVAWKEAELPEESFDDYWFNVHDARGTSFSLDIESNSDDSEKATTLYNTITKRSDSEKEIETSQLLEAFDQDLKSFTPRDARLLRGYILEGMTMREVANEAGISESRMSQLFEAHLSSGDFFRRTRDMLGVTDGERVINLDLTGE